MTEQEDETILSNEDSLATQQALEPEKEGEMTFRGRKIKTATMPNGQGFVGLRSLCDAFSIDYSSQRKRMLRTTLFRDQAKFVMMSGGRNRQAAICLTAFSVPAFLMGIETSRVADEGAKGLLDAFQEEGMIVLAEHFGLSERGEIRFLRESVTRMAIEQSAFEEMVVKNVEKELAADRQARDEKIQQIREAFSHLREQIRALEKVAGPRVRITPEQMGLIRETVMVLGQFMIQSGSSKNPWPSIYSGIAFQFSVSRTEDLTQEQFPLVLEFLDRQVNAFRTLLKNQQQDPSGKP